MIRPPPAISDSPDRFVKALRWLAHCQANHSNCQQWQSSKRSYRPARLIEVEHTPGSLSMRIISGDTSEMPYVTLSHCWGDLQPLRLLEENLSEFSTAIPMTQVPQAFTDAAAVTLHLGYQYLWIDSLCIIQDSTIDWNAESVKMGDIYRGAVVTITAPDSSSCRSGFRRPVQQPQDPVRLPYLNDQTGEILPMTVCRGTPGAWLRRTADGDAVFRRGWILQEHLLSTRILYATQWGMLWECQEAIFDESLDTFLQPVDILHQYRHIRKALNTCICEGLEAQVSDSSKGKAKATVPPSTDVIIPYGSSSLRGIWFDVVESFTARNLTKFKDRLPAISAVARIFAMSFDTRYIAGLWEDNFISELAWTWCDHIQPQDYPTLDERMSKFLAPGENYQAPSWSWAAFPRTVTRSKLRFRKDQGSEGSLPACFLEAKVIEPRLHSDSYSGLSFCSVTVSGLLKQVALHRYKNTSVFDRQEYDEIDVHDVMDDTALGWGCANFDGISTKAVEMFDQKGGDEDRKFSTTYEGWPVYLLLLSCENAPRLLENEPADAKTFENVHETYRTTWGELGRACSLIIAQVPGVEGRAIRLGICHSGHKNVGREDYGGTPRLGWYAGEVTLI